MRRGYTLIELLVVISIILVLSGMLAAGVLTVLRRARVERTHALLAKVATAIEAYRQDRAIYPAWLGTWQAGDWTWVGLNGTSLYSELLTTAPDVHGVARKGYLIGELQPSDVAGGLIVDAYGKPLLYYASPWSGPKPYAGNRTGFELWSAGPDTTFADLRSVTGADRDNIPARPYDPATQQ